MPFSLSGLIGAGNRAFAGYRRGQNEGEQEVFRRQQIEAESARRDAETRRDVEMDAMRAALVRAQTAVAQRQAGLQDPSVGRNQPKPGKPTGVQRLADARARYLEEHGTEAPRGKVPGSGGGSATTGPYNDRNRLQLGNTRSLVEVTQQLEDAESVDPESAQRPWTGAVGRFAAGVARHVDEDAAAGLENVGLSDPQTAYQGMAEGWVHNYLPNLPGFRMSVPMFKSVKKAFFPPLGEDNPDVIAGFTRRRREVVENIAQARQRGVSEEDLARDIIVQLRGAGAGAAAAEIEAALGQGTTRPTRRAQGPQRGADGSVTVPQEDNSDAASNWGRGEPVGGAYDPARFRSPRRP